MTSSSDEHAPKQGEVVVRAGAQGFRVDVRAGGHTLVADEPEKAGGTDAGPSPYDLLAAALGACTAMTLRMYADRKGLALEGVSVELNHRREHAADSASCEAADAHLHVIERAIKLDGPLTVVQRERLLQIAEHCPVHRTLTGDISIRSHLVGDDPIRYQ